MSKLVIEKTIFMDVLKTIGFMNTNKIQIKYIKNK